MFFHRTQHTDTHLIGAAEQLQAFLMLWADLPVQVADLINQFVPFESGRLKVRFKMLLAVRGQAHQAGLDGFVLLANADVAADILGSGIVVVRRRRWRWKGLRVALDGGMPGSSYAPRSGPLVVSHPTLGAEVLAGVVRMVPVGLQADGAEDVSTGDGHRISEIFLTEVAAVLIK